MLLYISLLANKVKEKNLKERIRNEKKKKLLISLRKELDIPVNTTEVQTLKEAVETIIRYETKLKAHKK